MRIPNYDSNKKDNEKRSLNNFINEDYRMLISGQSACGKTNTLIHMLRKPLVYYDKIYIYTRSKHQEKLVDLQQLMNDISKKAVRYQVLEIKGPEDILDTNEYPNNNRKIVIFDDLVNAPEKTQSKIANHFTNGRHHGISPVYIYHKATMTPHKS